MRSFLAALILFLGTTIFLDGRLSPLTVKDVALMLRAGDKPEVLQRELSTRHFVGNLSTADEASLTKAGAPQALVDALKDGIYAIPAEEAAAAEAQLAALAARRAAQAEESRKHDTLYQSQLARSRASAPAPVATTHPVATSLKGHLVYWKNGSVSRFDDQALEKKKLIVLYFSANWCKPCHTFTPKLVEFYNRVVEQHPEFEIVFVSSDHSQFAMETYMRNTQMPWPAVDYQTIAGAPELQKLGGSSIPSLIAIDASGRVVSSTYDGEKYLGPEKVVADLETIFVRGPGDAVAQTR